MPSASQVIQELPYQLNDGKVSVRDILEEMNGRSLLFTILILIVPNMIPFVNALGITHITGVLLLIFTIRMMIGIRRPWLPRWLLNFETDISTIKYISEKATPSLVAVEKLVRPRLRFLASGPVPLFIYAALLFWLTVVMLLPLPFVNVLPAAIMAMITLGLIQRDGVTSFIGALLAVTLFSGLGFAFATLGNEIFSIDEDSFFDFNTYTRVPL